jgi:hypothetical protein
MGWLVTARGPVTGRMAAVTLVLEALLVFFATLVASRLAGLGPGLVWGGGLGLTVACLLACAVVRRRGGLLVGAILQGLIVATGLVIPAMWVMGGLFVAMWGWLLWVGTRIDTDRARAALS